MADDKEQNEKAPLLVLETSGEDKYIVRQQIEGAPEGEYKQTIMSKAEVEALGGRVPTAGEKSVIREPGEPVPAPPPPSAPTPPPTVKQFAEQYGMSEKAAQETITRYQQNPKSEEFKRLTAPEIQDLNRSANLSMGTNLVEVGRQRGGRQFVTESQLEQIEKEMPMEAEVLKREGVEKFQEASARTGKYLTELRTAERERVEAEANRQEQQLLSRLAPYKTDKGYDILAVADKEGLDFIKATFGDEAYTQAALLQKFNKEYKDWTAKELVNGKVTEDGMYIPPPFGVKSGTYIPPPLEVEQALQKLSEGQEIKPTEETQVKEAVKDEIVQGYGINPELASMAAGALLYMLPVIGTVKYYQDAKKDGWTPGEIALMSLSVIADLAILAGGVGAVATAARAEATVGARMAAATKAAGSFALAEIKAPYTMIRHPVQTAKAMIEPLETIFRRSKVPLGSLEMTATTVRLPVKAFKSGDEAMTVRDISTLEAIREGKFTGSLGDIQIKLSPTTLQEVASPVAVHSTPDIRPFYEGATIQAGREGGLFVAPNLHSRFSLASAFGDLPEGGVPGALIIRDQAILDKLASTGKIYRGTVEVEALLKAGVELGMPSQTLITRVGGTKLTLLVFGEPLTTEQIARLKIIGAVDTIKNIFKAPAKIGGIDDYDLLNDLRRQATVLTDKIVDLERMGKSARSTELIEARRQLEAITRRADDLIRRLELPRGEFAGYLRLAMMNMGDRGMLDRWDALSGGYRPYQMTGGVRATPDIVINRRAYEGLSDRVMARVPTLSSVRAELPSRYYATTEDTLIERIADRPPRERVPTLTTVRIPPIRVPEVRVPEIRVPPIRITRTPPTLTTTRPPIRPPARRILERSPMPTATKPPIVAKGRGVGKKEQSALRKSKGIITWNQGALKNQGEQWYVITPPGKTIKDIHRQFTKPIGAYEVDGVGSAYKTMQQLGYNPQILMEIDFGAFDLTARTPSKRGDRRALVFKRDIKGKTKKPISVSDIPTVGLVRV